MFCSGLLCVFSFAEFAYVESGKNEKKKSKPAAESPDLGNKNVAKKGAKKQKLGHSGSKKSKSSSSSKLQMESPPSPGKLLCVRKVSDGIRFLKTETELCVFFD